MFSYPINDQLKLALPRPLMDAPILFALIDADRDVLGRWLPWVDALRAPQDETAFLQTVLTHFAQGTSLNTVIWLNDAPAGMISFNGFHELSQSADIGYWLGRQFRGQGVMTQAVRGLCRLGFDEYDLNKITIEAAVDNQASNAVAQHAGFHLDGTLRANELLADGVHDGHVWSLLKSEF
ncbi:GNAT family N-acetyltransferase [Lacticaseibacillus yichunensis]|uniref:GNAT family N-acetyltransferase n=1 Tax=Lacticaseibacillus yichunensis TaxID=2486015 RepID=A0ABW4CPE9_9LACO|nr:GNAT family protein [Lacticaseibacillus yichunensis]